MTDVSTATSTDVPPVTALMQVMNFTDDDLQANQAGQLGDGQIDRLQRLQQRTLLTGGGAFFVLTLVATGFLFMGGQNESVIFTVIGISFTVINAITVGLFGRNWMRLSADIRSGTVQRIAGELERVVKPGQVSQYVLRVEDFTFDVKKEVFKEFRHEINYAFYRVPHSGILLGAEPLI